MKTVCVVAPNWLGDAVMSLPLVGLLGASKDVAVIVLAARYTSRVFWGVAAVDQIVVAPKRPRGSSILWSAGVLRSLRVDAALILPPSFSSAVAPFLARVPVRAGASTDGRRSLLNVVYNRARSREIHLSEAFLGLGGGVLQRLSLVVPSRPVPARMVVSGRERETARAHLRKRGIGGDYVVVVPGATYGPAKSWPVERYRELVARLAGETEVVVAGSAAERELGDRVAGDTSGAYNLCGETGLGDYFALLEGASVVVANDSGSPHAAASLGTPVVVVFGSTSPEWTAPLGRSVDVISHPVHCSPCFRRTCPTELECFGGIPVDRVYETVVSRAGATAGS